MKIRAGRPGEARAITDLHLRTALHAYADIFPPDAPKPAAEELTRMWADGLGRNDHRGFVAEKAGALVGVVLAGPDPADTDIGHLSRLYVDPSLWGRGIGRMLYERCI